MDTEKNKNIYNKNDNIDGNKEFTIRFDLIKNLYDDMPSIAKKKIELKDCLVNKNGQIKIKEYKTKDGKVIPAIYLANNNSIVFRILKEDGKLYNIVFKKFKDLKEKERLENVKKTLIDLKDNRNLVIEKYCNDKGYCCVIDNSNYKIDKIGIMSFKNNNMTVCCGEDEIRIISKEEKQKVDTQLNFLKRLYRFVKFSIEPYYHNNLLFYEEDIITGEKSGLKFDNGKIRVFRNNKELKIQIQKLTPEEKIEVKKQLDFIRSIIESSNNDDIQKYKYIIDNYYKNEDLIMEMINSEEANGIKFKDGNLVIYCNQNELKIQKLTPEEKIEVKKQLDDFKEEIKFSKILTDKYAKFINDYYKTEYLLNIKNIFGSKNYIRGIQFNNNKIKIYNDKIQKLTPEEKIEVKKQLDVIRSIIESSNNSYVKDYKSIIDDYYCKDGCLIIERDGQNGIKFDNDKIRIFKNHYELKIQKLTPNERINIERQLKDIKSIIKSLDNVNYEKYKDVIEGCYGDGNLLKIKRCYKILSGISFNNNIIQLYKNDDKLIVQKLTPEEKLEVKKQLNYIKSLIKSSNYVNFKKYKDIINDCYREDYCFIERGYNSCLKKGILFDNNVARIFDDDGNEFIFQKLTPEEKLEVKKQLEVVKSIMASSENFKQKYKDVVSDFYKEDCNNLIQTKGIYCLEHGMKFKNGKLKIMTKNDSLDSIEIQELNQKDMDEIKRQLESIRNNYLDVFKNNEEQKKIVENIFKNYNKLIVGNYLITHYDYMGIDCGISLNENNEIKLTYLDDSLTLNDFIKQNNTITEEAKQANNNNMNKIEKKKEINHINNEEFINNDTPILNNINKYSNNLIYEKIDEENEEIDNSKRQIKDEEIRKLEQLRLKQLEKLKNNNYINVNNFNYITNNIHSNYRNCNNDLLFKQNKMTSKVLSSKKQLFSPYIETKKRNSCGTNKSSNKSNSCLDLPIIGKKKTPIRRCSANEVNNCSVYMGV